MKRILTWSPLRGIVIVAGLALGSSAQAQSVDELIAKNIEAHGGLAKLKAIESMKVTGKFTSGTLEAPMVVYNKRPGRVRIESTIQGKSFLQAYNGTIGWTINPFGGVSDPQKMSDEEVKSVQEQADIDGLLVDYKAKGNKVELVGKEEMEGTPVHKLKITKKNGDIRYMFLDAASGIELKMTSIYTQGEKQTEVETYFSDYKSEGGVMVAHAMENRANGQTFSNITIEKIEPNVTIDDAIFEMPTTATASAKDATPVKAGATKEAGAGKKRKK